VFGHPTMLEFAEDPRQAAVLLDQLQRHCDQRTLSLLRAAHHAAEQTI
jgi:hypothetical protein